MARAFNIAAGNYEIDPEHTCVTFRILHLGISSVHGRFNEVAGTLTIDDADPLKSAVTLTIPVRSIDTKVTKRDDHLRAADFFDVEKHPGLVFRSTGVRPTEEGLEVTGSVSLHGVTKPLTFVLTGGKTAEFPPGVPRVGYSTAFVLKRSDFGMKSLLELVGDEVHVEISLEGIRK